MGSKDTHWHYRSFSWYLDFTEITWCFLRYSRFYMGLNKNSLIGGICNAYPQCIEAGCFWRAGFLQIGISVFKIIGGHLWNITMKQLADISSVMPYQLFHQGLAHSIAWPKNQISAVLRIFLSSKCLQCVFSTAFKFCPALYEMVEDNCRHGMLN